MPNNVFEISVPVLNCLFNKIVVGGEGVRRGLQLLFLKLLQPFLRSVDKVISQLAQLFPISYPTQIHVVAVNDWRVLHLRPLQGFDLSSGGVSNGHTISNLELLSDDFQSVFLDDLALFVVDFSKGEQFRTLGIKLSYR